MKQMVMLVYFSFLMQEAVEFYAESIGGDGCTSIESNDDETWLKKEEKPKKFFAI